MPKAYIMTLYHEINDNRKMAAYAALAKPAIEAGGGVFLARDVAAAVLEGGPKERCVLVQFPSVEAAMEAYNSPAYQEALAAMDGCAKRDMRVVAGVE